MSLAPQGRHPARSEMQPTARRLFAALALGVLVGFAGTVMHRSGGTLPWGLVLSTALGAVFSVFVRAAFSRPAVAMFILGTVCTILGLTYGGSAGDVLVTGEGASKAWLVLAPLATFAGWLAPNRWFQDHTQIDAVPLEEMVARRENRAGGNGADDGSITAP